MRHGEAESVEIILSDITVTEKEALVWSQQVRVRLAVILRLQATSGSHNWTSHDSRCRVKPYRSDNQ